MKEKDINFYKKYLKYKNKYILTKKYLIGGTKPGENPVIHVDLQLLQKLLQEDIEINPEDMFAKIIRDDISYLRSTKIDEISKMIELFRLDQSNFMIALHDIETYGLKYIINRNGTSFNQTKCITFEDGTEYLANYKHEHRSSRVLDNFSLDRGSENPKHYSFTISENGIIYGIINDGIEFGATHIQLARNAEEKGIISGEIRLDGNNIIFNFSSSLFGFFNYLDRPRLIAKNADTPYTFEERIRMYKLMILTKKLIEISNRKVFDNYYYTQNILFPENKKPTEEEMRSICSDESLIILDTTPLAKCGSSKNIKTIKEPEFLERYQELEKKISSNDKNGSVCERYK
jgi:hypothetical protein